MTQLLEEYGSILRNSIGKAGVAKVVKPHQDNPALWVWTVETQYFELLDGFKRDAHAEKKKVRGDVRSRPFSSVPTAPAQPVCAGRKEQNDHRRIRLGQS
jgi:hypothetical protein